MPYTVGLQSVAAAFLSAGFATHFTVAVITTLGILLIISAFQKDAVDAPTSLPGLPLSHIVPFFRRRYDFLNWAFHATGQSVFQFKLLRNTVIVVSGDTARQAFFTAKGLDLTEGFKILSGAIPMIPGVTSDLHSRRIAMIHRRLAAVQREAVLSSLIPQLLEDSRRSMENWGAAGKFDPFENIYELMFQLTIRSISCDELAGDSSLVSRLKKLYDKLDTGTTPATVLLPWLPTPAMVKKLWATKEIYDLISEVVRKREEDLKGLVEGKKPQDALQLLLDSGDEKFFVVGFIMGLLIAGARATGTTASWLITFLAGHPEWAKKARSEVEELVAAHVHVSSLRSAPHASSTSPEALSLQTHAFPALPNPRRQTLSASSSPSSLLSQSPRQRGDSQSSTSHKRKRRNSGSSSDSDQDSSSSRLNNLSHGTRRQSLHTMNTTEVAHVVSDDQACAPPTMGFPNDFDGGRTFECGCSMRVGLRGGMGGQSEIENHKGQTQGRRCTCERRGQQQGCWVGSKLDHCATRGSTGGLVSTQGQTPMPMPTQGTSERRYKRSIVGAKREQDLLASLSSPITSGSPQTSTPLAHSASDARTSKSLSQVLAQIPLEIWENSTPVLDVLIKETLRVAQPHSAMRRNLGPELYIDGKVVPTGAYVVYPFSDVHLDEDIYEDAWKFDPSRWTSQGENAEKEKGPRVTGRNAPMGYVGWGGGKTMCQGTRLAKLELKLILAMFVLDFDFGIVDKKGEPTTELPMPNWNDILLCRPPKGSFYLGYARKDSSVL